VKRVHDAEQHLDTTGKECRECSRKLSVCGTRSHDYTGSGAVVRIGMCFD
jgi:hypothetical protein